MNETPSFEEGVFCDALRLPAGERGAYVEKACAGDDAGRDRVLGLLRGYEENSAYLERPAAGVGPGAAGAGEGAGPAFEASPRERAGDRIGRYTLVQELGEGGFGAVWMAEQGEPIRRRVALKIIKAGMDTREVIARFEAERQALALMDHPNIAHVFDAGETAGGRPYFAMELVRGAPITRYCDERGVPAEGRLRLFIAVCQAVQHAHQKGVIHRDLKPSNVLVTLHDGVPVPKIIDFGIAKATGARPADKTLFTQFHAFIGTPVYTSPEQMEMSGLDVDTRSDIYSLGVLLYELLAGRPPFDAEALEKSGLEGMRRIVREVEPPRPSQRVRTLSEADRTTVARRRGTDAPKLSGLLRGDLDWVAMRCLEKDRTRRYDTAASLARDVRRYLDNEPVWACPPTPAYRLGKFARRHKVGVAAAAAVVVSLAAGLATASVALVRERAASARAIAAERVEGRLRVQAEAGAEAARAEAAKNAHVAQFMAEILASVAPGETLGRDAKSTVLDKTARRLDAELRDQPEVAAKLRDALGVVYRDLGQYRKAETMLREAVVGRRGLAKAAGPAAEAELALSLRQLGTTLWRVGKRAESEAVLREALAIQRRLFGGEHAEVANTLYALSTPVGGPSGGDDESEELRLEALALRRRLFGNEHPDVALSLFGMGSIAREKGEPENAAAFFRESLAIRRRLFGDEHITVADTLNSLGFTLQTTGEYREAVGAYEEALAIRRKMYDAVHPEVCVTLLRLLALLPGEGRRAEAAAIARDVLAEQRAEVGSEAPELAPTLLALSVLTGRENGARAEAERLGGEARRLLAGARERGGFISDQAVYSMSSFGLIMLLSGAPADGIAMLEASRTAGEFSPGAENEARVMPRVWLARCYLAAGRTDEAAALTEQTLERCRKKFPPGDRLILRCLSNLGQIRRAQGRLGEAGSAFEEAIGLQNQDTARVSAGPLDLANRGTLFCELGATLNLQSRWTEAEAALRRAIAVFEEQGRARSYRWLLAQSHLGESLIAQGRFAEAEQRVIEAYHGLRRYERRTPDDRAKILGEALARVVRLYRAWGKAALAADWETRSADAGGPLGPGSAESTGSASAVDR